MTQSFTLQEDVLRDNLFLDDLSSAHVLTYLAVLADLRVDHWREFHLHRLRRFGQFALAVSTEKTSCASQTLAFVCAVSLSDEQATIFIPL